MTTTRRYTPNGSENIPFKKHTQTKPENYKEIEFMKEEHVQYDSFTHPPIPIKLRKKIEKRISSQSVKSISSSVASAEDADNEQAKHEFSPQRAWAEFNDTIVDLDDTHVYFNQKKEHRAAASTTFRKALEDLCGSNLYEICDYESSPIDEAKIIPVITDDKLDIKAYDDKRLFPTETVDDKKSLLRVVDNTKQSGEEQVEDVDNVTKEVAKRGWKVLKRQVNESILEHNIQTHKLNWTMLRHTIRQLANLEDSRQDLYERYGVVPTTLPDGSVVCENRMLSDRARAKIYSQLDGENVQKRPNSYQPPALQTRNQMQKEYEQRPCNKTTGVSNMTKRRCRYSRAVTAT
ncbi:uncharacterized protein LOC127863165 [Dreissena polymorpha]|uniref:Uncharacterized protein n=1 Tax=Dreissena polymorpha TaxID=45954 RepID=A0A9D3Y7S8_DREPO|nr:uncharacterized protein LOC127863165 [Dreissena polymorpha]KAH3693314.1 hypothetical protein DPMN_192718 [Dreissena polymorpha]